MTLPAFDPKAARLLRRRAAAWDRYVSALWPVARDSRPATPDEYAAVLAAFHWFTVWDAAYWNHTGG